MAKEGGDKDLEAAFFEAAPDPAVAGDVETTEKVHRAPGPKAPPQGLPVEVTEQIRRAPGPADGPMAGGIAPKGRHPIDMTEVLPRARGHANLELADDSSDGPSLPPVSETDETRAMPAVDAAPPSPDENSAAVSSVGAPADATPSGPARPLAAPLPMVAPRERAPDAPPPAETEAFTQRIEALRTEANAQPGPSSAPIWFEIGWIFENDLHNLREAAGNYQRAHQSDPTFLPVIHAARRLFSHLEKWRMVVILLDEELKIEDAPRAALLLEKGRIFEGKLASADEAIKFYREALEIDPGFAPAVDAITRHLTEKSAFGEMADVLERGAVATENDAQRLAWRVEAARLCETHLDDKDRARALLERAQDMAPDDFSTLMALRRLYALANDDDALEGVLAALARVSKSDAETARFLLERAQILASQAKMMEAAECVQKARALTPDDTQLLAEAARLFERIDDPASLVDVLRAHALASGDKNETVALFAEAGALAEEKLGDSERAIELYRQCIALDPSYSTANNALGRLFAREDRIDDLIGLFESQLSTAEGAERVPLLFKFAELLAEKASNPDRAIDRLRELLGIMPTYVPALKYISALLARAGRFDELVAMYEAELEGHDDRDQSIFLLEKIGVLCEQELGDLDRAIAAYKRMLDVESGYLPALRSLGRLYAKTQRWSDLVAINAEEAQIIGDQNQIVALFHRNGEIYETHLDDVESAVLAYKHALTLMPNYLPALKALGALYGRAQRWEDLVAMHRQEAEVARTPMLRAQLLARAAQILEDKISDRQRASAAWREVLEEVPTFAPAIRALLRIAQADDDVDSHIEVLRREADALEDKREKALLHCRVAELLERHLKDSDAAVAELERGLSEWPALVTAHRQLIRLHERTGHAADEAKARERMQSHLDDDEARVANLRALAEVAQHRLGDSGRALEALAALVDIAPGDVPALRAATRAALTTRDYRAAISYAEALCDLEEDAEEVAHLHLQIANWKEGHLDPPEDALPNFLKALEYAPLNPTALRAVERAYIERQAWEGLYALYDRERSGTKVPSRRADLSLKMAEIAERRLGRPEDAALALEEALEAVPTLLPAATRLKELYGRLDRGEDQLRLLGVEAALSKDPARSVQTLLEVAEVQLTKFNNPVAAATTYRQVLEQDPTHSEAFAKCEALLQEQKDAFSLVSLYRHRAMSLTDPSAKRAMLKKSADLAREAGDAAGAAQTLQAMLEHAPDDTDALRALGMLYYEQGNGAEALKAFERLVDAAKGSPPIIDPVATTIGVLLLRVRNDSAAAIPYLERAFKLNAEDQLTRSTLAEAYATNGRHQDAIALFEGELRRATTNEQKLNAALKLAELYDGPLNDPQRAAVAAREALAVAPADQIASLAERVAVLYQKAGDLEGYLSVAESQAEMMATDAPERAAELLGRCAALVSEHLNDGERALSLARKGLDYAPYHIELRGFVGDVLARSPNRYMLAVEEHRKVLRAGRIRVPSLQSMYRMWSQQRAHDRAFLAAETLVFLGEADEEESHFFTETKRRVRSRSDEALAAGEVTAWVVHPDQRNAIHDVLATVADEFGKLWPADLSEFRVEKKDILKSRSDDALRRLADNIGTNLGGVIFDIHRTRVRADVVTGFNTPTATLMVSANVTQSFDEREQRYLLGQALMAIRCGHHLIRGMGAPQLIRFLNHVARGVDKSFEPLAGAAEDDGMGKKVASALSRGAKRALAEPVSQLSATRDSLDIGAFIAAMGKTEARAGLLVSGHLAGAVRLFAQRQGVALPPRSPEFVRQLEAIPGVSDLFEFAVSDAHFLARQKLRTAIDA